MLQNISDESAERTCHVVLPDGSETWLPVAAGHTVGTMLEKLGNRLHHQLEFVDVINADTNQVH